MYSLSPRYDLFRFSFPKDFIPQEVRDKYNNILAKNQGGLTNCIDYLNESIQGVNMPGISEVLTVQAQHGSNANTPNKDKLNVEPKHDITYTSSGNPLEKINKELKITFRQNQGFYNYFMLYETMFYQICKPELRGPLDVVYLEILSETGVIIARVKFFDLFMDGIEGLEFNYNKIERDTGTFDVTFKFNNIDFEYIDIEV